MKRIVCKLGEFPFNYNKISNGKVLHFITFISILLDAKFLVNMLKVETKTCKPKKHVLDTYLHRNKTLY